LFHPRIVHLCDVKDVAPSKRLNSKALIYIFHLFVSWFHNILSNIIVKSPRIVGVERELYVRVIDCLP